MDLDAPRMECVTNPSAPAVGRMSALDTVGYGISHGDNQGRGELTSTAKSFQCSFRTLIVGLIVISSQWSPILTSFIAPTTGSTTRPVTASYALKATSYFSI